MRQWQQQGRPPVGAELLKTIQNEMETIFDGRRALSPASIARILADEGAELRHPQIIEFDAEWREANLKAGAGKFHELDRFSTAAWLNLDQAETFIAILEKLRRDFENDDSDLTELRRLTVEARERAQTMAKNRTLDETVRAQQAEIAEWLRVWLQTPALFADWLELRRRSNEFRRKFPGESRR